MNRVNNIQMAPAQPIAVINVVVLPDLQVRVQAEGQINQFVVNGALESARQVLLVKIEEAAKGPKIEQAPPGLTIH